MVAFLLVAISKLSLYSQVNFDTIKLEICSASYEITINKTLLLRMFYENISTLENGFCPPGTYLIDLKWLELMLSDYLPENFSPIRSAKSSISSRRASLSIHLLGISPTQYSSPARPPVTAPVVSVSSPKLTAFKTASL